MFYPSCVRYYKNVLIDGELMLLRWVPVNGGDNNRYKTLPSHLFDGRDNESKPSHCLSGQQDRSA